MTLNRSATTAVIAAGIGALQVCGSWPVPGEPDS